MPCLRIPLLAAGSLIHCWSLEEMSHVTYERVARWQKIPDVVLPKLSLAPSLLDLDRMEVR